MKKSAMIAVAAMVAGVASADLSVSWISQTGAVEGTSGGNDFLVGSTIELIYSDAGVITVAGGYVLPEIGETVLATGVTGGNSLWNFANETFIGDYTSGFFFTRVYENDGSAGEFFLDVAMAAGTDWVFDDQNPGTAYGSDVVSGIQYIGANETKVAVPEPATLGLMGIAGLGMFLARKKARS